MDSRLATELLNKSKFLLESPSTMFQVSSLPVLIEYLDFQMHNANSYNLGNNVGILKIYLLYPHETDVLVVQKILILSLSQLPKPDFTICLAQIPLHVQSKEPVSKLVNFHTLLQNCMFLRFWECAKSQLEFAPNKTLLDVPGLCDSLRRFIIEILPMVYHQLPVPEARKFLNYSSNSKEFEDFMTSHGWSFDASYVRSDQNAGFCHSTAKEESSKTQKGGSSYNTVEKYLRTEPMTHYYNTLHN